MPAAAALELALAAYEALHATYGPDHWRTVSALALRGASLMQPSQYAEVEPLLLEGYEGLRNSTGARPVHVETVRQAIVENYAAWGRPEEASRYSTVSESGQ